MRVLIVEDELLIRMDLERRLRMLGADVLGGTATGEEAVEMARSMKPDAVLMDIKLRGALNGEEAARQILSFHNTCRVVFISAFDTPDIDALTKDYNASIGYAPKPIATSQLRLSLNA